MFVYDNTKDYITNLKNSLSFVGIKVVSDAKEKEAILALSSDISNEKSKDETNHHNGKKNRSKGPNPRLKKMTNSIRERVINDIESGKCTRLGAAAKYGLHYEQVTRVYKRFLESGSKYNKQRTLFRNKLNDDHAEYIRNKLKENSTYPLKDFQMDLFERFGVTVSRSTVSRFIIKSKYGDKKVGTVPKSAVTIEMREYCQNFLGICCNEDTTIIFFDEMEFEVSMYYSTEDQKTDLANSMLHTKNLTIMAALTKNELLFYKALEGSGTKELQFDFLSELIDLLETLDISNATMVMGNSCDPCDEIENLVLGAGHEVLYLPPYSPFFNPVEKMFGQWKSHLRSEEPCDQDHLKQVLSTFYGAVTQAHCEGYYNHTVHNATCCISGSAMLRD